MQEIELFIQVLEVASIDTPKTVILISQPSTWVNGGDNYTTRRGRPYQEYQM